MRQVFQNPLAAIEEAEMRCHLTGRPWAILRAEDGFTVGLPGPSALEIIHPRERDVDQDFSSRQTDAQ